MSLCPPCDALERPVSETARPHERLSPHLWLAMISGLFLTLAVVLPLVRPEMDDLAQLLGGIAAALVGVPIMHRAWLSLRHPDLDGITDLLVSLALLAAWAAGDLVTAALVPLVMVIGHAWEERSLLGTREAIANLAAMTQTTATRLIGRQEETVDAGQLRPDDILIVRPGEVIAADGIVENGHGQIDTAALTGESLPVLVDPQQPVLGGSLSLDARLRIRVTRAGSESTLGKVVALLEEAEQAKPAVTRVLERHAGMYLPLVIMAALAIFFSTGSVHTMLAVLVASCPCALALAAPATAVSAVAVASRYGVLVRSAAFLETLAEVDTLMSDKTGTMTEGRLHLTRIEPVGMDRAELLASAAALASASTHPVSRAIAAAGRDGDHAVTDIEDMHEEQGMGVLGQVAGKQVVVGRPQWVASVIDRPLPAPPSDPASIVAVAIAGDFCGWIVLQDRVRDEAADACTQLRELGLRQQVLISGDQPAVVQQVGAELGFDTIAGGVLPADKLARIEAEQRAGRRVLMLGDGINDCLALRAGSVSLAMGAGGSDLALASADLVLMNDDLTRIPTMVRLARRCRSTVNVNVALAIGWTVIMFTAASFGLIGPLAATLLHNLGTVAVIANAGRLLRFQDRAARADDELTREQVSHWYSGHQAPASSIAA